MIESTAAVLWAGSVTMLLGRAVRQYRAYVNVEPAPAPPEAPHVAVVIPARNERDTIGDCLNGLATQTYPSGSLSLFVVDDNSSDGTAAIVHGFGERMPVRLIAAGSPPQGWTGKSWACSVGATAAAATGAAWICFIDADVVPYATLIASAVAAVADHGLDMLSLVPAQKIEGPAQALVLPTAFLMLAMTQDLRRINSPAAPEADADGQFILIRRTVYDRLGGHAAVGGEFSEDRALARRAKQAGFRVALYGGERLSECRMYRSSTAWWHGLARNASEILNDSRAALMIALVGVVSAVAAPLLPIWTFHVAERTHDWHWISFVLAMAASTALLITHVRTARYFRLSALYGLCFPVGYLLGAAILVHSAYRRLSGTTDWKGRTYIRRQPNAPRAKAYSGIDGPDHTGD